MARLARVKFKSIPGTWWGTPKELWGFRAHAPGSPVRTARRFLDEHQDLLGLEGLSRGLRLVREIRSVGATHVLFQQHHRDVAVNRGYVTVHVSRGGAIYLVKNRAIPRAFLPPADLGFEVAPREAKRRALAAVGSRATGAEVREPVRRWWPDRGKVQPTYRVRVLVGQPRAEWLVYIDGVTGAVRSKYDNLAKWRARARVFDPNPVAVVPDWRTLLSPTKRPLPPPESTYRTVSLPGLTGSGMLDGKRASTCATRQRARIASERFEFRSGEPAFLEAMAYFHVDRVLAYVERLGYRGSRAIFHGPVAIDAHGTRQDQSWYSPDQKRLTFGTGGVNDAEDAELVVHELGHAIQDAICPDFGQSPESAAIGEGFGDYLAASFFSSRKPGAMRDGVMAWDAIASRNGDPPALRRMDGALTFESFDHDKYADEHVNGTIWSATLWGVWKAVGRDVADRIILESHFQLDAYATLARGARAILDADRNLFAGRHAEPLRKVFRARGIGPVE